MADVNGWIPARWCHGDAELRIGLSGPGLIDVTGASWFSELHGDVAVSATQAGWADGHPLGVITVQVGDGVTEVAATSGEVSDRAVPIGAAAILLLPRHGPPDRRLVADLPRRDLPGPRTRWRALRARPRIDLPAVVVRDVRRSERQRVVHGDRGRRHGVLGNHDRERGASYPCPD